MQNNNYDDLVDLEKKQEKRIKTVKYIISSILAIAGSVLLLSQFLPLINSYLNGEIYKIRENSIAQPLPQDYKDNHLKDFGYDPGISYFQNLLINAGISYQNQYTLDPITKQKKEILIDSNYSQQMKLTISDLQINNINLVPNVNSYDENVYNAVLKNGLAHFKGTPLPGDGGNSFIYGHSSVVSFFNINPNNPEVIFSKLENAEVGQKVEIVKDGANLVYTIRQKKIVEPDDTSILNAQQDKETVTLMTCWPLGIGTKRLVVIAERNE